MGFPLSPLIRYTLQALYWALVLPLPMLLSRQADPVWVGSLLVALLIGWGLLLGSLSQQVNVDDQGMRATYPAWVPAFLRQEWQVQWSDVERIEPRSTSQGGVVYYWVTQAGDRVLLPMRVAHFKQLWAEVQKHTGLNMGTLRPYVQPWMYGLLGILALLLLAWDGVIGILVWNGSSPL